MERRLRELRGRVKAARAVVSTTPGLAEILQREWKKAALFYARFGITETQFRAGVRDTPGDEGDNRTEQSRSWVSEKVETRLEE
ncbi:MAG: hypothetical protein ABSE66_09605 [Thermoplasmata archaeon]